MRRFGFLALALAGCATTETTREEPVPVSPHPQEYAVSIGIIQDQRLKDKDQRLGSKQVQIGAPKVKNEIADVLTRSRRFREVVNLPTEGNATFATMLESARAANCQYLVVGEIDQFDIVDLGANPRMVHAVVLEGITFPIGVIVFLLSERKCGIWTNGIVYDRTAMGVISVSLHVIETENGKVVGHLSNLVSRATKPVNALVYGDLSRPEDDYVDIGKELGGVALHNLAVAIVARLDRELERVRGKR